jgi:hypothetical protein
LDYNLRAWRKTLGYLGVGKPVGLSRSLLTLMLIVLFLEKGIYVGQHVPIMQKRVLLQSYVNEGGLKIIFKILHAPFKNASDKTLLLIVLYHEFFESAVLQNRNPRFQIFDIYYNFALQL